MRSLQERHKSDSHLDSQDAEPFEEGTVITYDYGYGPRVPCEMTERERAAGLTGAVEAESHTKIRGTVLWSQRCWTKIRLIDKLPDRPRKRVFTTYTRDYTQ